MKKTVKGILLLMIMLVAVVALAGCGKKDEKKDDANKLVATKETKGDSFLGDYKERVEITFENDKATTIVMTMELADEDTATAIASLYSLSDDTETEGLSVKSEGNKLIMTMDAKAFAAQEGIDGDDDSLSKDSLRKSLEEDGYTIQ